MVSIIENWAIIVGFVVGIAPVESDSRFQDVTVKIAGIESFESYPMLLVQKPGESVAVRVRSAQIHGRANLNGTQVSIRVRRGTDPQLLFAHPDWSVDTTAR